MSATALFRVQQATLGYQGSVVLRNLNLHIAAGERVALLGRSGAGKSTLLRHLRALHPNAVAWCPQSSGLVPMLSVFHNIYMGRLDQHSLVYNLANLIRPLPKPREDITKLADSVGLLEQLYVSVERLSGGQQSRTNLARALYQQRSIFLGDEPVSAVDEVQADQLLQLIAARHQTLVLALHDVDLALRHCTRIIGLRNGAVELDQLAHLCSATDLIRLYGDDSQHQALQGQALQVQEQQGHESPCIASRVDE